MWSWLRTMPTVGLAMCAPSMPTDGLCVPYDANSWAIYAGVPRMMLILVLGLHMGVRYLGAGQVLHDRRVLEFLPVIVVKWIISVPYIYRTYGLALPALPALPAVQVVNSTTKIKKLSQALYNWQVMHICDVLMYAGFCRHAARGNGPPCLGRPLLRRVEGQQHQPASNLLATATCRYGVCCCVRLNVSVSVLWLACALFLTYQPGAGSPSHPDLCATTSSFLSLFLSLSLVFGAPFLSCWQVVYRVGLAILVMAFRSGEMQVNRQGP